MKYFPCKKLQIQFSAGIWSSVRILSKIRQPRRRSDTFTHLCASPSLLHWVPQLYATDFYGCLGIFSPNCPSDVFLQETSKVSCSLLPPQKCLWELAKPTLPLASWSFLSQSCPYPTPVQAGEAPRPHKLSVWAGKTKSLHLEELEFNFWRLSSLENIILNRISFLIQNEWRR